ncbi:MAG: amidohydrolase family protein [Thermoanaerobaculia bacterium]
MSLARFGAILLAPALAAIAVSSLEGSLPKRKVPSPLLVTGATLIDGTGAPPVADSWVLIQDGRFSEISTVQRRRGMMTLARNVKVVDGSGKWILPGFVDAHVHLDSRSDGKRMIRWGVTAARWMSEDVERSRKGALASRKSLQSPDLFPASPIFTAPGGWWSAEGPDRNLNRFPSSAAEAREAVRTARRLGSSEIKIMDDDMGWCRDPLPRLPQIRPEVFAALIREARQLGLRVAVHAPRLTDARDAVRAGATVLAHGILDEPLDADTARAMTTAGIFYVPTLDIYDFLADPRGFMDRALADARIRESLSKATLKLYRSDAYFATYRERYPNSGFVSTHLKTAYDNVARARAAGVQIALGTDMWAFPGAGVHLELEDLVAAGFAPLEAIRAATLASARSLGIEGERGSIQDGKRADFVLLENDPLRDVRNSRSIERVYKGGRLAWSRYGRSDPQ